MREMKGSKVLSPVETIPVPVHFRCPISLELMRDPVTVATGHTYDRSSIEHWLASNRTCPVTRLPLPNDALIPNHTLRRLILDWAAAHPSHVPDRSSLPSPQPADPSLLLSLVRTISGPDAAAASSSLRRLRSLAFDSDKNRSLLSQDPNLRPALQALLFATSDSVANSDTVSDALALTSLFPPSSSDSYDVSSRPERLAVLAELLCSQSPELRVNAATLVENLAVSPESRVALGEAPGIIAGIVDVLRPAISRPSHPRAARAGAKALLALCLARPNREAAVAEGAAIVLVDLLGSGSIDRRDAERVLATLELLCRTEVGCESLAQHALAVPLLVKAVLRISDRATESTAGVLLALCRAAESCQKEAVGTGAVTQMLLLVQSDCSQRAKRKAQLLLKLLWSSCPDQPAPDSDLGLSDLAPL